MKNKAINLWIFFNNNWRKKWKCFKTRRTLSKYWGYNIFLELELGTKVLLNDTNFCVKIQLISFNRSKTFFYNDSFFFWFSVIFEILKLESPKSIIRSDEKNQGPRGGRSVCTWYFWIQRDSKSVPISQKN